MFNKKNTSKRAKQNAAVFSTFTVAKPRVPHVDPQSTTEYRTGVSQLNNKQHIEASMGREDQLA